MAKISMIERQKKRVALVAKYAARNQDESPASHAVHGRRPILEFAENHKAYCRSAA